MRKKRAILFDDDPAILAVLTIFFEDLDYEVITHKGPVPCPIYQDNETCHDRSPCADIMVTDLVMPGMSGLQMLALHKRRGCGLDARNKAIHSGNLDPVSLKAIEQLGCACFHKPARLADINKWVRECESRMDLTQPLGVPRRERRTACEDGAVVTIWPHGEECVADVVNCSPSGSCLSVDRPLEVGQVIDLKPCPPSAECRAEVRWLAPKEDRFLAGIFRV